MLRPQLATLPIVVLTADEAPGEMVMKLPVRVLMSVLLLAGTPVQARAQATRPPTDLADATLEELMNIVITIASRSPEGLAGAPARVQAVTGAQIARRGYRSVVELLKDLPDFKLDLAGAPDFPVELTIQGTRSRGAVTRWYPRLKRRRRTVHDFDLLWTGQLARIISGSLVGEDGADAFSAVINIISKDVADAPGLSLSTAVGQFGLQNYTASYGARLGSGATLRVAGQVLHDRQADLGIGFDLRLK
jgi:iron complex outermembrane recepter protein